MEETIAYIGPLEKNSKKSFLCENGCTADIISSNIFKNNEQRNCTIVPEIRRTIWSEYWREWLSTQGRCITRSDTSCVLLQEVNKHPEKIHHY